MSNRVPAPPQQPGQGMFTVLTCLMMLWPATFWRMVVAELDAALLSVLDTVLEAVPIPAIVRFALVELC